MDPLYLKSFRGGMNVTDPPSALSNDQTVESLNLDFDTAPMGSKRRGSLIVGFSGVNLSGSSSPFSSILSLHRFLPTDDAGDAQLVVEAIMPSGLYGDGPLANLYFAVEPEGWTTLFGAEVMPYLPADGQMLHGKMFLTIPVAGVTAGSIDDRLYVYDPATTGLTVLDPDGGTMSIEAIRKVGVWEPDAPTVDNQGSGSFSTTRYYRIRGVIQVDNVTEYRSEPSESVEFDPSGTGASARVTRPSYMEGTHWEVEESLDDVNFYRIATVVITSSTYDDSLPAEDVSVDETLLSDDIGDNTVPYAPKYVAADEDRLLLAGALYQDQLRSRVAWTPVGSAAGVGNDERLEEDTDPFVDLDGYDGGPITGMDGPINGFMWVMKDGHIYKLVRTGSRQQSYIAVPVTKVNGAVSRSIVSGLDESGNACVAFLDPRIGPMLIGTKGLKTVGEDIREGLWSGFNDNANYPAHGIFYSAKQQFWWWIATGDSDTPNVKIVVDVKEFTEDRRGYRRGWSKHTGTIQECLCSTVFADNLRTVQSGEAFSSKLKPFFGTVNPIGSSQDPVYQQKAGSYSGTGAQQDIDVGFQPDVVFLAPFDPSGTISSNSRGGLFYTPSMASGESLIRAGAPAITTSGIIDIKDSGFTLGTDVAGNRSGITYYYVAIKDVDGTWMKYGTYSGNGLDNRDILIESGFSPDFLWIHGTGAGASANGVFRQTGMVGDYSVKMNSSSVVTDQIQSLGADGFQVGAAAAVNASGATFYYVAWEDDDEARLASLIKLGSIAGDGSSQQVTGVGFEPEHLMVTGPTIFGGVWKTPDL